MFTDIYLNRKCCVCGKITKSFFCSDSFCGASTRLIHPTSQYTNIQPEISLKGKKWGKVEGVKEVEIVCPKGFPIHISNINNKDINIYRQALTKLGLREKYFITYNKAFMNNGKPYKGASGLWAKKRDSKESYQIFEFVKDSVSAREERDRKETERARQARQLKVKYFTNDEIKNRNFSKKIVDNFSYNFSDSASW